MKHLYVGDDGLTYNTPEECQQADKVFAEQQKQKELSEKERKAAESKQKKELAAAVEEASEKLAIANNNWRLAKEKAARIQKEAEDDAHNILLKAAKEREEAARVRLEALNNFRNNCGPYTLIYSDSKVNQDFKEIIDGINDVFQLLF